MAPIYKQNLRLNVFKGIDLMNVDTQHTALWKIKTNIEWVKNCPLPKDEVFMRLGV